jgi:diadenosine tetraphosphate (Ap4A) HIT family hydrolase
LTESFALDARLAADTGFLADWPLCRVLLMNDSRFPWIILVPRLGGVREIFELDEASAATLMSEVTRAARALKTIAPADKMNIGALGNIVPQLHIHIVARRKHDAAWPRPVWGAGVPVPYADLNAEATRLRSAL